MCLMIASEQGFKGMDYNLVRDIFRHNPDGFGFFYPGDDGRIVSEKAVYNSPDPVAKLIQTMPDDRPVVLHFRMATHGDVTAKMAHPFQVTDNTVMAHNGVLNKFIPEPEISSSGSGSQGAAVQIPDHSDTLEFLERYLRPSVDFRPTIWRSADFQEQTERMIGSSNKLAIMDGTGNYRLYNFSSWVEYEGMWFSNMYAWPYMEYVEGYSPTYLEDLENMSWEEIFKFVQDEPEEMADIIFYDLKAVMEESTKH